VFFDFDNDGRSDHVGLVADVYDDNGVLVVETIEGNNVDYVAQFTYYNNAGILGYGVLPENPKLTEQVEEEQTVFFSAEEDTSEDMAVQIDEAVSEEAQVPAIAYPAQSFTSLVSGMNVIVNAEEGAFPEGTRMEVNAVETDDIIRAVSGAVEKDIVRVQAVDITFYDADNNEIEPLIPVRVLMRSAGTTGGASEQVVVHVEDNGQASIVDEAREAGSRAAFDADSFSVYALVYTVDFEYSVNGKMYQFSLPGGGFVSFTDLVEVLGILGDTYSDENNADIEDQITDGMLDVTASEAAKKFVADVESVEFSSPELVWGGKVDAETTVGALKEANGLECQYSAELTEEQIEAINGTEVESGDWALISMLPFSSEEELTVTMKDGEVFTIKVTDAQIKKTVIDAKGDTWEITVTYDDNAEIPDGAELKVKEILPEDEKYDEYYQQSLEKVGVEGTEAEEAPESIVDAVTDALGGLKDLISGDDTDEKKEVEQTAKQTSDYARIFDIQIWADDQEIQPKSAVTVNIKLLD
ncbi:MAG: hypothetical protein IJV04_06520, partial [Lachnospiraceae bacterium]|nr:hypothetical protein [Lachnospiraceae bacterium]